MINRVVLVGRMVRNPELTKLQSGISASAFTLAIDNMVKPGAQKTASFINCKVFGAPADNLAKYTRKGSLLGVEGRLSQRMYENKEGKKVNYVEVICDRVQFLDPKGSNQGQDAPPMEPEAQEDNQNKSKNLESIDIVDDDLPF